MTKHGVGKDANLVGTWDRCHHSNIFFMQFFCFKKNNSIKPCPSNTEELQQVTHPEVIVGSHPSL